jgi:acetolactate synthase regulatory subunit
MFLLELHASDMHAALGRLLDQARVAGLRLAAVSAEAQADDCRISASIDIDDRDVVDRLARRVGTMVCIGAIQVRGESACATSGAT